MFTYSFIYVNGGGTDPLDDDPKNLNVLTFSAMVEDKGTNYDAVGGLSKGHVTPFSSDGAAREAPSGAIDPDENEELVVTKKRMIEASEYCLSQIELFTPGVVRTKEKYEIIRSF
ncbi:Hypothetical predicted protein [Olea europaea subsp. europaea]|uniref:Uncharacterized protein n=1 Tax=Olea europaea subsp. europaea TaxID=158383 RepID=A0A8S0TVA8_OLEEU|nr:Hypothetical predicted protein [Olea europaea subsp. europaea]